MKKAINAISLYFFILLTAGTAHAEHKITANIIDMSYFCYITGVVSDASGNGVYPAEVIFTCNDGDGIQTRVDTLPGGNYINSPPPCNNYTITATAPARCRLRNLILMRLRTNL